MNANTAKAIKEIIEILKSDCGLTRFSAEKMEKALHDLAEGIKLDAIEP